MKTLTNFSRSWQTRGRFWFASICFDLRKKLASQSFPLRCFTLMKHLFFRFCCFPHHFGWERTKWVGRVTKWWLNVRVPPTHHLRFKIPFIKKTWLCHLLHVEITALVRFTWRPFIRYLAFHKMHLSNCLDLKLDMFEKHQTAHPRVFNPWFKNCALTNNPEFRFCLTRRKLLMSLLRHRLTSPCCLSLGHAESKDV